MPEKSGHLDLKKSELKTLYYIIKIRNANLLKSPNQLPIIHTSKEDVEEFEIIGERIGSPYASKFGIPLKEGFGLRLLEIFTKIEKVDLWRFCNIDWEFSYISILVQDNHIIEMDIQSGDHGEMSFDIDVFNILSIQLFPHLRKLQINGCNLIKIGNVELLTKLEYLDLSYNKIRTMKGVDKLKNLKDLILSHNLITRMKLKEVNESIKFLNLKENPVESLRTIDKLIKLEELFLSVDKIVDFGRVYTLKYLTKTDLPKDKLSNEVIEVKRVWDRESHEVKTIEVRKTKRDIKRYYKDINHFLK